MQSMLPYYCAPLLYGLMYHEYSLFLFFFQPLVPPHLRTLAHLSLVCYHAIWHSLLLLFVLPYLWYFECRSSGPSLEPVPLVVLTFLLKSQMSIIPELELYLKNLHGQFLHLHGKNFARIPLSYCLRFYDCFFPSKPLHGYFFSEQQCALLYAFFITEI